MFKRIIIITRVLDTVIVAAVATDLVVPIVIVFLKEDVAEAIVEGSIVAAFYIEAIIITLISA